MIIKNNLRPTTIRTNSRFRGPTELEKYANFVLETAHDLKLLGSVMDRNDFIDGHRGQTDFIDDNLVAYVGGGTPITSNIATATTLYHPTENMFTSINLMNSGWTAYGGCTKQQTSTGVRLIGDGLLQPAGVSWMKYVEEGQIIYMRVGVKLVSGDGTAFTIGSHDINQGEGDLKKVKLPTNGSIIYVDKRLYCKHREPIELNIDVYNLPDMLKPATVEISSVEIKYMTEEPMTVQPTNTVIKSRINDLENKINNIINNI
jgi:hypothetical protein